MKCKHKKKKYESRKKMKKTLLPKGTTWETACQRIGGSGWGGWKGAIAGRSNNREDNEERNKSFGLLKKKKFKQRRNQKCWKQETLANKDKFF